jgi:uncharacterized protein YycO
MTTFGSVYYLLHIFTGRLCAIALTALCLAACRGDAGIEFSKELSEGDLVFRRGRGSKTRAVLAVDSAGLYSHVGIVCGTDSGLVVVHAVPGEGAVREVVKAERPGEFFSPHRAVSGAVCRLQSSEEIRSAAARYALDAQQAGLEFDHDYDLEDSTRLYCTELVWRAFGAAGVDLSGGRRSRVDMPGFEGDYIMPSDIYCDTLLKEITKFPNHKKS